MSDSAVRSRRRSLIKWVAIVASGALVLFVAAGGLLTLQAPNATAPATASAPGVDVVGALLDSLRWGNVAFNVPRTIRYGKGATVEVLVSSTESPARLEAELHDRGGAEVAPLHVSNRMAARLTGDGFQIQERSPAIQAVGGAEPTRWTWEVTPTSDGDRTLELSLDAQLIVDGQDTPRTIRTFTKDIVVSITLPQRLGRFVTANWQWLWGAVLVPVLGVAGAFLRKRLSRSDGTRTHARSRRSARAR
jgi:hypothetical protein